MSVLLNSPTLEEIFEMAARRAREPDGEWNLDILAAYGRVAGIKLAPQLRPRVGAASPPDAVFEGMADGGAAGFRARYRVGGASLMQEALSSPVGAQVESSGDALTVTGCPLRERFNELGLPCVVFCQAMRKALLDIYYPALAARTARSGERCRIGLGESP